MNSPCKEIAAPRPYVCSHLVLDLRRGSAVECLLPLCDGSPPRLRPPDVCSHSVMDLHRDSARPMSAPTLWWISAAAPPARCLLAARRGSPLRLRRRMPAPAPSWISTAAPPARCLLPLCDGSPPRLRRPMSAPTLGWIS